MVVFNLEILEIIIGKHIIAFYNGLKQISW